MPIKKGSFVEINYTGKFTDSKEVFDTTVPKVAKEAGIDNPKATFEPIIMIIGENQVIPGLDKNLEGKDVGSHTFDIEDIDAFGKKQANLMKLIPAKVFAKDNIKPMPGLQVNVDGQLGVIRSASGGRIIVDFNHPLASKDVTYDVEVKRIITDKQEQLKAFITMIRIPVKDVKVDGDKATVTTGIEIPTQYMEPIMKDIDRLVGIKDITFKADKPKDTKEEIKSEKAEVTAK